MIFELNQIIINFFRLSFQTIRINSIEILTAMSNYPTFVVLPYAQDVLFGLQPALDDHKRLVRNATVLARNKWYLVGAEE